MNHTNDIALKASDATSQNGSQLDTNNVVNISFHAVASDATAAGTLTIQASNDVCPVGQGAQDFVVSHWVNIPSATATLAATAGGGQAIITIANAPYRWMRAVYTSTVAGTGTVTVSRFSQFA